MISAGKMGPALSSPPPEVLAEPFKSFFVSVSYRHVSGTVTMFKDKKHTYQDIDCCIDSVGIMVDGGFLGRCAS
jgi:hypothetical protein